MLENPMVYEPFEDKEEVKGHCKRCKCAMYSGETLYNGFCEECADDFKDSMSVSDFADEMGWEREEL